MQLKIMAINTKRIIEVAFVCKAFEDTAGQPNNENLAKQIWFVDVDKFALCIFIWLVYDREISSPLATSFFLRLPKYYTL